MLNGLETSNNTMRQVVASGLVLLLCGLAACSQVSAPPSDFRFKTLDPATAVEKADSIVLASPARHREITSVNAQMADRPEPLTLLQLETDLNVEAVLKGASLPRGKIRFRHYSASGFKILMGPPGGPSGPIGSVGIFFLRQKSDGTFRSIVDVYRPDIPMPWLVSVPGVGPCATPSICIANLLLTYHDSDDERSFSAHLLENVAMTRQLTGFFSTFDLLNGLANNQSHPEAVRRAACVELSKWYALELPSPCGFLIAGTQANDDYLARDARLRQALRKGGVTWIQHQIGAENVGDVKRDIELLMKSPDEEVRALARSLARGSMTRF
jgi:hypothetical protein